MKLTGAIVCVFGAAASVRCQKEDHGFGRHLRPDTKSKSCAKAGKSTKAGKHNKAGKSCKGTCEDVNGCIFKEDSDSDTCTQTGEVLATASEIINTMTSIGDSANIAINSLSTEATTIDLYTYLADDLSISSIPSATSVAFSKTASKNINDGSLEESVLSAQRSSIESLLSTASSIDSMLQVGLESFRGTVQGQLKKHEVSLQLMQERSVATLKAYAAFLAESLAEESTAKKTAIIDFRNLCSNSESSDVTPEQTFFHLYGFACGVSKNGRACDDVDAGMCPHGLSKGVSLSLLQSDVFEYKTWILSNLASSMYLYSVCLPPTSTEESCTTENGRTKSRVLLDMKAAFDEVASNMRFHENCYRDKTSRNRDNVLACVRDRESRQLISLGQNNYVAGEPEFLDVQVDDLLQDVRTGLEVATKVFQTLSTVTAAVPKLSAALGAVGGALSIASMFVGKSADDITQELIKAEFKKLNTKIDKLGEEISEEFLELGKDIGDLALDEVMANLDRIQRSFDDYVDYNEVNEIIGSPLVSDKQNSNLLDKYAKQFRFACNELSMRPEDIILYLYGHLCGDAEWDNNRCENSRDGSVVGTCNFGRKNRSYLLDKYRRSGPDADQQVDILTLERFERWIIGAMSEALFLQAVCIPLDENTCPTSNDSIFQKRLNQTRSALVEATNNLEGAKNCTCPCKNVTITRIEGADGPGSEAEARIFIDGKKRVPLSGGWLDIPLRGGIVLPSPIKLGIIAEGSEHVLRFEEYDTGSGNEVGQKTVTSDLLLTQNGCVNYEEVITIKDDAGDEWKFTYKMQSVPSSQCPAEFCSAERPDCQEWEYCDFQKLRCTEKRAEGEECDESRKCLSNDCMADDNQCAARLPAGGECITSSQCLNFDYNSTGTAEDIFRCFDRICSGRNNTSACANSSECLSGSCENDTCVGRGASESCAFDDQCESENCSEKICV